MTHWIDASDEEIRLSSAIALLTRNDEALGAYLFDQSRPRLRERAGILRDDSWKFEREDQLRIRAALDLWSGGGHLFLFEIIEDWGQDDWRAFLKAICLLKGIRPETLADEAVSEMIGFLF